MTKTPRVSVIIPVRNEELRIKQCIEGILSQSIQVHEIIVIDSGSTDETLPILTTFPEVTLIQIDGSTFNHGLTRNLVVQASTGDFCLLTVGDAYAYDEFWIQHLLDGFIDDEVMAVCGQQVVDHLPENNPIQWFRPVSEPTIRREQFSVDEWKRLSSIKRKQATGWDDVNAMYRRSALISQPFEKTSYSEDAIWANVALERGHALVYNPKSRVYHYHNEDPDFAFRRALTSHYFRYKLTGSVPANEKKTLKQSLSPAYQIFWKWRGPFSEKVKWWRYNRARTGSFEKARSTFIQKHSQGDEKLDEYHSEVCGKPPIPTKGK